MDDSRVALRFYQLWFTGNISTADLANCLDQSKVGEWLDSPDTRFNARDFINVLTGRDSISNYVMPEMVDPELARKYLQNNFPSELRGG